MKPEEKPVTCKTCPLYSSTEGIVWGQGPSNAKMMLVGEAPGEEEGAVCVPFVGGSGRLLNVMLHRSGIRRDEVFVTNTVKCRPTARDARGRIVNRQPSDVEIQHCARFLLNEITTVNPNTIVALGNIPLKTLTGTKRGIMDARSVPIEGSKRRDGKAERYKVIGTFHPAYVARQQAFFSVTVYDLARARIESATPVISRRPWKRVIHARLSDVGESLERRIREPRLGGLRYYHHDLETTGLDPRRDTFRCVGIAAESDEVFCFDWTNDVIAYLKRLHADPELLTVGQNSEAFDIPFQEAKGFEFNGPTFDTLIGFHLLNPDLPKDLGFIGAGYTDEPYWKDETMYKAGEDALQHGCAKDIHATARAFEEEVKELIHNGQLDLYFNHIMPVQPVLRKMTRVGIKKDIRKANGWTITLNKYADDLERRLKKGLNEPFFNVDSPKQLMDLLYRRMGLPVQYKDDRVKGLRPSVDADALDDLAADPRVPDKLRPILLLVRDIRTFRKWDSTFIRCEHDDNGYVHGHFSTAKAANGRLNSYNPNMQNYPGHVREIMVPDSDDHVFLSRDWSQIEWRIAMTLSGDKNGLDALAAGRDAHIDAYAKAFNKAYESVTKGERFDAKTINYGLLYGRGERSLAEGKSGGRSGASRSKAATAIPIDRVRTYMANFLRTFNGFDKWRQVIEEDVKRQQYVASAWGRRRYWYSTANMPEAYNFPISSAAASMMYEALVEVDAQLPKHSRLVLTIHDELLLCAPKSQKELQEAIDCTRDIMEKPFPQLTEASLYPDIVRHYFPNGWYCETDGHIGVNWRKTKEESNKELEAIRHQEEEDLRKHLGVTI